tara:strand:+ start:1303 stop:1764 length:462 start_codon:yes stop_codon:yes gene_type:complete
MTTYDYSFYIIQSKFDPYSHNYVGSSKDIQNRIRTHKSTCNNKKCINHKCKLYETIRSNGGWKAFELVVVDVIHMTEQNAHIHEQIMIEVIQPTLNTYKAYTGMTFQEYQKQYNIDNVQRRNERCKIYNKKNAERLKIYRQSYYNKKKSSVQA